MHDLSIVYPERPANFSMDNLATIFNAVRRKLKVDIEVHTVKMAS